ncbi:MAG: ABC-ATPase domain-containing protein [Gammaproteobacteria bacterium]|nr:ABC-ATPase domain-containing protein [Gammaproteobacteria bacterium]
MQRLKSLLKEIDRRGYKSYKRLEGRYHYPHAVLEIDHVQGDPFAEPSRCRLIFSAERLAFPPSFLNLPIRITALEDYIGRSFHAALRRHVRGNRGSGRSGEISFTRLGQQLLQRNAVVISALGCEIRFRLALPADLRRVNSRQAQEMFFEELPQLIASGVDALSAEEDLITAHLNSAEDQESLRQQLRPLGLVAFVANGATLPRESGVSDCPLSGAVPFEAPATLAVTIETPHRGAVTGLGIRQGVTLIVGGGFHGKSTLLHALELGVYNHIPGDGREQVVTDGAACKIRAEDGRAVSGVDITPFINNLPQGIDTRHFSSLNSSGSTSQAANIMEALATGCRTLLLDEDTSASNLLLRDERMQALVRQEQEPITPLVEQITSLSAERGVAVVLVAGGSGAFFRTADTVVMLDHYRCRDVTAEAKALAGEGVDRTFPPLQSTPRLALPHSLSPETEDHRPRIQAVATRLLRYGREEMELTRLEQLVDRGQLLAIGYLIARLERQERPCDLVPALQQQLTQMTAEGLDTLPPYLCGDFAMPRLQELVAVVNRMRQLQLLPNP